MNGIAVLAAKEVALASGFGSALLPSIPPSAVDGFAAGTLLSGACFLLVALPRRSGRKSQADDALAVADMAEEGSPAPALASLPAVSPLTIREPVAPSGLAAGTADQVAADGRQLANAPEASAAGKHRLPVSSRDRAEAKRSSGKHAAPSSRRSVLTAGLGARRQLADA